MHFFGLFFLSIFSGLPWGTNGAFNLYITQDEMHKLLGIGNELFYVRDGTVNQFATEFVIPVPNSINKLCFVWALSSPYVPLQYTINVGSSNTLALPVPALNISQSGNVPSQPQVWQVSIPCSGLEAVEVIITIEIELTGPDLLLPSNSTYLRLKRKKMCQKFTQPPLMRTEEEGMSGYVIFFTSLSLSVLFVLIVISLAASTWIRAKKRKEEVKYCSGSNPSNNVTQQTDMATESLLSVTNNATVAKSTHQRFQPIGQSKSTRDGGQNSRQDLPKDGNFTSDSESRLESKTKSQGPGKTSSTIDEIAVDRLSLTLGDLLLEGTFGRIYQGRLQIDCDCEDVMVKTVLMGSSSSQIQTLVMEGSSLYSINHKHILTLVATTYDGSSPMMIYPYSFPGNLKKWLSTCRQPVSTHQAVCLGLQLLTALKHLHKRRIIHRDVAARNCYLSSSPQLSVKLCDPALSRDLFSSDYHCLGNNENRPVKWMAVESISSEVYSSASDVWAWGVTMWEIMTRAQQPFADVDPFEMENYLMEGFRLHQPVNCPDQLYSVMASCWAHSPHHRTSIHNLYNHLANFSSQLQQFV